METGRPEEVTVIVYRGKGLQGKKKGRGKFHVVFSVGGNKFKSDVVDEPSGDPQFNNEAEINVDNPQEPLILKVREKDDIIGQVIVPLAELPNRRTDRQRCVPLQPHKKCPHPQGELVFSAWISRKGEPQHTSEPVPDKAKKAATLDSNASLKRQSLAGLSGSQASLNSVDKKKSMMKKLKGALSHSPKLGGRRLSTKSTSMMDLGPQPMSLAVVDVDLRKSNESLKSHESGHEGQRRMSTVERLKHKMGRSPMASRKELSKSNSKSCTNLAALSPEMKLSEVHGSNESLGSKSTKSTKSGSGSRTLKGIFARRSSTKVSKPIPAQFDLSKPSPKVLQELEQEEEFGAVPFKDEGQSSNLAPKKPPRGPPSSNNSPSHSHSSSLGTGDSDSPFQRRQNSLTARKRPDLSHRSPALLHHSPLIAQHDAARRKSMGTELVAASSPQNKNRNVFAINADMNSDLWTDEERTAKSQSPLLDKSAAIKELEEIDSGAGNPFEVEEDTNPFETTPSNPFDTPTITVEESNPRSVTATPVLDTPSQKKKIAAPFVFSPSDDEEDEKKVPEISGVSPREGSTEGGTKVVIRGEYLGKNKDDIVTLTVCGVNCLPSLEYFSSYKIACTTVSRKPGSGKIVIETKKGGLARSTIDYIFVQPKVDTPPKPPREQKKKQEPVEEKSQQQRTKEIEQNYKNKEPSPPKEVLPSRNNDADTKMAVVEPMSRAKVQAVKAHTRNNSGDLKRQAPGAPTQNNNRHIVANEDEDYNKEDLLKIIRELQTENKKLNEDNQSLRSYIDNLVMRVITKCPEVLCTDMSAA